MKMKKIAVIGNGNLGRRLVALNAIPMSCNILDKDEISREIKEINPDVIINAAGLSNPDRCEKDYERAVLLNVWGHNILCDVAKEGTVVLISSEYVFDGTKGDYKEDDEPCPINSYGLTKIAAEGVNALYRNKTIRLSRTFNAQNADIKNYINSISRGRVVKVPSFFIKNYVHTDFSATAIMHLAENIHDAPDIMHYGGELHVTFYELVCRISKRIFGDDRLVLSSNDDSEEHVKRPRNCSMNLTFAKTFGSPIFSIEKSIEKLVEEMRKWKTIQ